MNLLVYFAFLLVNCLNDVQFKTRSWPKNGRFLIIFNNLVQFLIILSYYICEPLWLSMDWRLIYHFILISHYRVCIWFGSSCIPWITIRLSFIMVFWSIIISHRASYLISWATCYRIWIINYFILLYILNRCSFLAYKIKIMFFIFFRQSFLFRL